MRLSTETFGRVVVLNGRTDCVCIGVYMKLQTEKDEDERKDVKRALIFLAVEEFVVGPMPVSNCPSDYVVFERYADVDRLRWTRFFDFDVQESTIKWAHVKQSFNVFSAT
ncbi:hypothetical protein GWI33_007892 [Rhynchophorus ferrugineus]|uniref:Uncharacterized protein n=1 Tax=Rhynchophorus ferrugineus TaxID=354439 RepID=A0A834IDK7_RHYFE|nr:hypothetical protein GWI33_007892 [Rhynchophorus ferrugineus]